ncbi:DUF6065 family protein [Brucella cytisi]|uniref:DUF6065 family protein n=1 Tax=Brucella cytisi TaxID=407152 RepID=UPI0035D57D04
MSKFVAYTLDGHELKIRSTKTEPEFDLFVTGSINRPKDAISPLTGFVETDWSPYTFTMNWRFTHQYQTEALSFQHQGSTLGPVGKARHRISGSP